MRFTPAGTELVIYNNDSHSIHVWDLRKIRKELSKMGLDWDLPPYSVERSQAPPISQLDVIEAP